jgi:acetyltransferase-like isoleucine patch superfamily enzyme
MQAIKYILDRFRGNSLLGRSLASIKFYLNGNSKKIKGRGNIFNFSGASLKKVKFDIVGDENTIVARKGTEVSNSVIRIRGSGHCLQIGEQCRIKGTFWFEDVNGSIVLGDKTTTIGVGIAVTEPGSTIRIGSDCMLAYGIDIRSGDSHSIIDLNTNKRINFAQDVNIGDHVWIGADVRILKGISIGNNSIIGSNAVVTKSIPDNCIAAGVPARVVKNNVTWSRKRIYEK